MGPDNLVEVYYQSGNYYYVVCGDYTGYVKTSEVRLTGPLPSGGGGGTAVATGTVDATSLNMRSAPSTGATVLTRIPNGAKVDILEKGGSWHKIRYNGQVGYVSAEYIKIAGEGGGETVVTTGTVNASSLNLRSAPSTSASRIGSIPRGAKVDILEKGGSWHKVKYNGQVGYVSAEYIILEGEGGGGSTPSVSTGKVNATSLNLRSSPSTSASILTRIPNGATVEILETTSGWYKVRYNGTTGYVSADYINTDAVGKTMTVTASALNVRTGAGTNYPIAGQLPRGTKVEVLDNLGEWLRIRAGSVSGYVSAQYLD